MSLAHAILGLLKKEPMTGYDLKTQCFDTSIAHFWPADQSQIYRTLDQMAEEGWVESALEVQQERPNRKVFSITPTGKQELLRWLGSPPSVPAYREPFLIQLFFAEDLPNTEIRAMLQQQLDGHRRRQQIYGEVPLPPIGAVHLDRRTTLERLTLELGLRIQLAYIDWLEFSIEVVEDLEEELKG